MSKRKVHFESVYIEGKALCGTKTTQSFLTQVPDDVTCRYCRQRNLNTLAKVRSLPRVALP